MERARPSRTEVFFTAVRFPSGFQGLPQQLRLPFTRMDPLDPPLNGNRASHAAQYRFRRLLAEHARRWKTTNTLACASIDACAPWRRKVRSVYDGFRLAPLVAPDCPTAVYAQHQGSPQRMIRNGETRAAARADAAPQALFQLAIRRHKRATVPPAGPSRRPLQGNSVQDPMRRTEHDQDPSPRLAAAEQAERVFWFPHLRATLDHDMPRR
jgi:hypothetical protein